MATSMPSTSARLRKTFKYPSDDERSDASRDEMDEEEQEDLIASFKKQEKASNAIYVIIFSILPLLVIPAFLFYFFTPSSTGMARLLCILGITSLLASAFSMCFLPMTPAQPFPAPVSVVDIDQRGFGRPPPLSRAPTSSITIELPSALRTRFPNFANTADIQLDPDGPLLRSLPYLNAGICVLLFLAAWTLKGRRSSAPEGFWLFCLLPGIMGGMIVLVRSSMKELQEGIGGLEGLKYQYRGA